MTTRRYQQRLRAEAAEQTRRRVLDAVYQRLRAAPAEPVSLDQVARTAGVARSTIYLIFGSRAGLFDAVTTDLLERGDFDRVLRAVADPDARVHLREGIRGGVHAFVADRDVYRVLFSTAMVDPEATGGAIERMAPPSLMHETADRQQAESGTINPRSGPRPPRRSRCRRAAGGPPHISAYRDRGAG